MEKNLMECRLERSSHNYPFQFDGLEGNVAFSSIQRFVANLSKMIKLVTYGHFDPILFKK